MASSGGPVRSTVTGARGRPRVAGQRRTRPADDAGSPATTTRSSTGTRPWVEVPATTETSTRSGISTLEHSPGVAERDRAGVDSTPARRVGRAVPGGCSADPAPAPAGGDRGRPSARRRPGLRRPQVDRQGLRRPQVDRPRLRRLVPAVLLLAVVLAGGAVGVTDRQAAGARTVAHARTDAVQAAVAAVPDVLGYDYRTLDAGFARAQARLAPPFLQQYRTTTAAVVAPTARQYHAVVTAAVSAASGVSASDRQVVVLLFVDQTTKSDRIQGSQVDQDRVQLTMVASGGGWKVGQVDAL
jgi:Mce-associated membrane protein